MYIADNNDYFRFSTFYVIFANLYSTHRLLDGTPRGNYENTISSNSSSSSVMIGMLAIVGLNTVDANMTSSEGNYTSGTNATSGNMTSGNATSDNMAGDKLDFSLTSFLLLIISYKS